MQTEPMVINSCDRKFSLALLSNDGMHVWVWLYMQSCVQSFYVLIYLTYLMSRNIFFNISFINKDTTRFILCCHNFILVILLIKNQCICFPKSLETQEKYRFVRGIILYPLQLLFPSQNNHSIYLLIFPIYVCVGLFII